MRPLTRNGWIFFLFPALLFAAFPPAGSAREETEKPVSYSEEMRLIPHGRPAPVQPPAESGESSASTLEKPEDIAHEVTGIMERVKARDKVMELLIPKKEASPKPQPSASAPARTSAEVRAFVDRSRVTVGERLRYTIEVDTGAGVKAEPPGPQADMGGFEVKRFGEIKPRTSRDPQGAPLTAGGRWYELETFTVGSYVIPAQPIELELANGDFRTLKTPEIFVAVVSVMQKGEHEELRDIKPPLALPGGFPAGILLYAAGGVLGLLGLGWGLYFLKRPRKIALPPALPPEEKALRELERIERMGLVERHESSGIKEYYYLVSGCLRVYLEERFHLRASEQATEEFLESVIQAKDGPLAGRQINLLKEYLNECDLVKYAKFEPGRETAARLLVTTREFIEETRLADSAGAPRSGGLRP